MKRRSLIVMVGAALCLLVMSSSALAHFCYVANRSPQGAQSAAGSPTWISISEILTEEIGLCPAGVEHVLDGIEASGLPRTLMIHGRTIMAQGLEHKHPEKLHDGRGIEHLSDADFAAFEILVGEAFPLCG